MGTIQVVNLAFTQMLGYFQSDLRGLPLDFILPCVYRESTRDYLIDISNHGMKGHLMVYVVHKNGYLQLVKMRVRLFSSVGEDSKFLVTLEIEKNGGILALTDTSFRVAGVSEEANRALGLSRRYVSQKQVQMQKLCPEIFSEHNELTLSFKTRVSVYYCFPVQSASQVKYYKILSPYYESLRDGQGKIAGRSYELFEDAILLDKRSSNAAKLTVSVESVRYFMGNIIGYVFTFKAPKIDSKAVETLSTEVQAPNSIIEFDTKLGLYMRTFTTKLNPRSEVKLKAGDTSSRPDIERGSFDATGSESIINFFNDSSGYKSGETTFAGVVSKRIAELQLRLKGSRLLEFNDYLQTAHKPTYYGKNIKTCDLARVQLKEKLPPVLLGKSLQKVADETMKCPGNVYLQKQSEDYRIRVLLRSNEMTTEYVAERYRGSRVLALFMVVFGICMLGVIALPAWQFVMVGRTKKAATESLTLSFNAFDRTYLELMGQSLLLCASYVNE